ncbi:MAG: hypothetical protein AVDCRST_MAG64-2575 [uncultured Phycisphaerae bacterium]|uniref:Flagellin N-terminal domain-containing protein n=1 Tax=uncultured Phycisphaerae bacterium TaxID=904963 RepID=A0A6J4PKY7_9BACT|nr:MAG: hypothetical protein AVDCRST_MAG64-2575 [uncultured Phycisphaerae bacterium]
MEFPAGPTNVSRISTNFAPANAPGRSAKPDPTKDPAGALRRLGLTGRAGNAYDDVLELDADGVRSAARTIDAERERLELAYNHGREATAALAKIEELLAEASELAAANGKGLSRGARKGNQKKIDALLAEVDATAAGASATAPRLLDGSTTLAAAEVSLHIPDVSREGLGRVIFNGQLTSLKDVATRGALDTSRRGATRQAGVRAALTSATETVRELRTRIATFQDDALRPRLGDVATVMAGLFDSARLGSGDAAIATARELRAIMLSGVTAATAVGAEGWDRERVLELLQP